MASRSGEGPVKRVPAMRTNMMTLEPDGLDERSMLPAKTCPSPFSHRWVAPTVGTRRIVQPCRSCRYKLSISMDLRIVIRQNVADGERGAPHGPRPSVRQARSVAILTDIDISTIEGSQADISTGEEG